MINHFLFRRVSETCGEKLEETFFMFEIEECPPTRSDQAYDSIFNWQPFRLNKIALISTTVSVSRANTRTAAGISAFTKI